MRVLLVPNPRNSRAMEATATVAAYLVASGHEPLLGADGVEAASLLKYVTRSSELGSVDLVCAFGGDGTILQAVHSLDDWDVPILGVNLGRLGFLSGAESEHLLEAVESALSGRCAIERRQTVEIEVEAGGITAGPYRALNEVFVGRGGAPRGVELEVLVGGVSLGRCVCDGVIAATPTGSTAYALSAGGPIVSPCVRGVVLVAVAAHTLQSRALVVAPDDELVIRPVSSAVSDVCLAVDGDEVVYEGDLMTVRVRVGAHDVPLVRFDRREYYETLSQTFFGA